MNQDKDAEYAKMEAEMDALINVGIAPSTTATSTTFTTTTATTVEEAEGGSLAFRKALAAASVAFASGLFFFQHSQPVSSVALLKTMEAESMTMSKALCNGKPTLVEFYAPWCESCKVMAPTMRALEKQYEEKINFVTIDGANPKNSELVGRFHVDGIPHVAFISKEAEVKTALVGAVPKQILKDDITALLEKRAALPYEGFDAFQNEHFPLSSYASSCSIDARGSGSAGAN